MSKSDFTKKADELAVAVIDTPDDPCWNDGFNIMGSWEQVDRTFSAYVSRRSDRRKLTIRIYPRSTRAS